ncbi:dihydromonapterin reductase [Thiomicrorhabdus heinhorstiae]|uniref:Dihydromonapterin reductase n=1 Tax=Thiomicrorhabdus heinhorstiae TaxID=2748010 RepID=A0ABS0BUZ7_9GAMM|nr:dihydromonapterin reductase [Thiomicrorhabdus heinhorstiae]MBF6057657.1 dihydromonapterin reductase [Thiomicrorhabdus heinhorstiae]
MEKLQRAVVITGGGQRIGAHLVRQFLLQGEYPVVFTYRRESDEVAALRQAGARAIHADFSDSAAIDAFVETLKATVGSLRGLIHNASLWCKDAEMQPDPSLYEETFRVHVEVPYRLNQACEPLFHQCEGMRDIISISDSSVQGTNEQTIAYLASKAAMQNMSKQFAKRLAPEIKVNDIAPGLIMFHEGDPEDYRRERLRQSAIGIEPGPDVVWQAVHYLMNSPYSTGLSLPVDGGRHL